MAAIIVGTYDASTWVDGDYSTYPQLPPGVPFYQIGMGWKVTAPGIVNGGLPVAANDVLFALPRLRQYGDYNYGDKPYGQRSIASDEWEVDELFFLPWDGNAAPPDQIPYPNSGCPFTPDHGFGGSWAPGWRIVVDCYYDPGLETRAYGNLDFGDLLYGGPFSAQGAVWTDITQPSFHIETGDGMADGGPRVVVSELVVSFLDPVGRWFDFATPNTWRQPQPGTPIRVGLLDPFYRYHPVITAKIERIEDVHDGDGVREVSVRGFGQIMDLVVDVPNVLRPVELASVRFSALAAAAGWTWDADPLVFPPTGDANLLADKEARVLTARDEMDRTVQSVGWFLDSDRRGRMRVRPWPHEPVGQLVVVDCYPPAGSTSVVSHSISFANDESQLLNYVLTGNTDDPQLTVLVEDAVSVARFGRRGRAHGYPLTGLAWSGAPAAQTWAARVLARYRYITRQVESFEVDTAVDNSWLKTLVDLDTGRGVQINRTAFTPMTFDGVIVGWRWRLDPGRWQGQVFVATTTESL